MLARATLNVSRSSCSDTPLQRKRGGLPGSHWNSVCFAQTAALRREGGALSEKRKGHEEVDQVRVIHNASCGARGSCRTCSMH